MKVIDVMTSDFVSIQRDASLDEAMEKMSAEDVRHLPVMDGKRLVGVLSERDLLDVTGWLPRPVRDVLEAPSGKIDEFMHAPVVTASPEDTIVTGIMRMLDWGIGCLPVMDEASLVGMLTEVDVLDAYSHASDGDVISVDSDPDVSTLMSTETLSAERDTPADEAVAFCRSKNIRHLPVQAEGRLVGIVSDRDFRMSAGRGQLEGVPIGDLVASKLRTVEASTKLSSAAHLMVRYRIGALPVVDGQALLGVLSTVDILEFCTRVFGKAGSHVEG